MACQSLEGEEILNVRWATEDPNPTSKDTERQRIEVIGRELMKDKVDPKVIDAMRTIRALEDEQELDEYGFLKDGDEQPERKRPRLEAPESEPDPEPEPEPEKIGLLNKDTLESLKYFAEIRKRSGPTPVSKPSLALDYGSDDE